MERNGSPVAKLRLPPRLGASCEIRVKWEYRSDAQGVVLKREIRRYFRPRDFNSKKTKYKRPFVDILLSDFAVGVIIIQVL